MRRAVYLDVNPLDSNFYRILAAREQIKVQDPTHIGTKLRNRILKPSISLPFGNKAISVSHLKVLLINCPKDIHGLVSSDVSPIDRQNFKSLQKVMESRVTQSLKTYVIDSEATVVYINICKNATSCYLDKQLTPLERIYRIWNSTFLLRIWRQFILESDAYNLKDNFISHIAHACIEVNAISLTQMIIHLRDIGKPEMFRPYLFDSQPCESTFRQMRSMATANWTKINFSMSELLHLIERVELQNEISFYKLVNLVKFPRINIDNFNIENAYELPSNEELMDMIQKALTDAMQCASQFGMNFQMSQMIIRKLFRYRNESGFELNTNNEDEYEEEDEDEDEDGWNFMERNEGLNLRDYRDDLGDIQTLLDKDSKYIEICEDDGSRKIVLKSSLVWLLSDSIDSLSNDRLKRVQTTVQREPHEIKRRKLQYNPSRSLNSDYLFKSNEIHIGQWCIFSNQSDLASDETNHEDLDKDVFENCLFGSMLAFKYTEGKNEKEKQYRSEFITVLDDKDNKRQDVEVLAAWYKLRFDGILISLGTKSCLYIIIKHYIATTKQPTIVKNDTDEQVLSLIEISQNRESFLTFL